MKQIITLLVLLAVVQLSVAQSPKALRLMADMGLDSVTVDSLNQILELEKSAWEKQKDTRVVDPLFSLGAQYGFFGSLGSTYSGVFTARTPGLISKKFLVFAGELTLSKNEKLGDVATVFVGFDIIRSGGCNFIGLSAKNKRQNLPKYAVIHMDWRVGVKQTFILGATNHGFTSVVSKFAVNVTPRYRDGRLSPVTFSAGFEVGPYIDNRQYRRDAMHPYLKKDDWTYFNNKSNWEFNDLEATFFVGVRASMGGTPKKLNHGTYQCPVF